MSDPVRTALGHAWAPSESGVENWIERNFSGHGRALRTLKDPPITGEPFMSMADAKQLARDAIKEFSTFPLASLRPLPTDLHWLGDREAADETRHATDMRGCVLYFEQQSDCLEFMRRLTAASEKGAS